MIGSFLLCSEVRVVSKDTISSFLYEHPILDHVGILISSVAVTTVMTIIRISCFRKYLIRSRGTMGILLSSVAVTTIISCFCKYLNRSRGTVGILISSVAVTTIISCFRKYLNRSRGYIDI